MFATNSHKWKNGVEWEVGETTKRLGVTNTELTGLFTVVLRQEIERTLSLNIYTK